MPKLLTLQESRLVPVDYWITDQQLLAERVDNRKALAVDLRKDPTTIDRWLRGQHPIPTHESWKIVDALGDLWFLQRYATRHGYLIIPRPILGASREHTLMLIASLSEDMSRLLRLAWKLENEQEAVPADVINETVDRIQQGMEQVRRNLLEQIRQQEEGQQ